MLKNGAGCVCGGATPVIRTENFQESGLIDGLGSQDVARNIFDVQFVASWGVVWYAYPQDSFLISGMQDHPSCRQAVFSYIVIIVVVI